jgi:hypothetical protein
MNCPKCKVVMSFCPAQRDVEDTPENPHAVTPSKRAMVCMVCGKVIFEDEPEYDGPSEAKGAGER